MDSQEQKRRDKYHQEEKLKQGSKEIQQTKQQQQQQPQQASPPQSNLAASPPSLTSSPSHEFSFTISLQPSSAATSTTSKAKSTTSIPADKSKSSPASFALDLSPADEIFFHGHLLPLHLLSHLPVSPRSSTNSLDSFTLPINDLQDQDQKSSNSLSTCNAISSDRISHDHINNTNRYVIDDYETRGRSSTKSKSFSLFGLSSKWRKENVVVDTREKEDKERQKRKLKFDHVSHVLKRYMRMVRPLLSFGNRRGNHVQFPRQGYSYSGNLSLRRKPELIGRRGEFSAPASMRTSPTNSGLLVATGTLSPSCSKSDSTMEELQAAIQAAIAHCKNSIAMEEKIKCHE